MDEEVSAQAVHFEGWMFAVCNFSKVGLYR
jgi:hypothetical protein